MQDIKESDWKTFKPLRDKALERFDHETFRQVDEIINQENKDSRDRYYELYKTVRERDKVIERLFNHFSRSWAVNDIANYFDMGLIKIEELEKFSEETRDEVRRIISFWNRDRD